MYEIASLKSKKLSELQEIAKSVGVRRLTGLKKMELIYQIIDTVAASPLEVKDNQPPIKGKIDSVAKVNEQTMQDKKANENLKNENPKLKVEEKLEQQKSDKKDPGLQQNKAIITQNTTTRKEKKITKKLITTEIIVIDIENQISNSRVSLTQKGF